MKPLFLAAVLAVTGFAADRPLSVLVLDGMNNHDWQAGTRAIESILSGTGRFRVEVCTSPCKPDDLSVIAFRPR